MSNVEKTLHKARLKMDILSNHEDPKDLSVGEVADAVRIRADQIESMQHHELFGDPDYDSAPILEIDDSFPFENVNMIELYSENDMDGPNFSFGGLGM